MKKLLKRDIGFEIHHLLPFVSGFLWGGRMVPMENLFCHFHLAIDVCGNRIPRGTYPRETNDRIDQPGPIRLVVERSLYHAPGLCPCRCSRTAQPGGPKGIASLQPSALGGVTNRRGVMVSNNLLYIGQL